MKNQIEVKNNTDMFHIELKFEDTFSFAKTIKTATVSGLTLRKMLTDIGKIISHFDKETQIRSSYKLIEINRL